MKWTWIPVSEKVPSSTGNVQVTDGTGVGIGWHSLKKRKWHGPSWLGDITHWMLLPRPPKGNPK